MKIAKYALICVSAVSLPLAALAAAELSQTQGQGSYQDAPDQHVDRSHPGAFVRDSAVTAKIKARLASENLSSLANVHVDTDANGMVVLSGTVPTDHDANYAMSLARETEGVRSVTSTIQVRGERR
jgi:hyperosmotically inducible periplasmic protein